MRPCTEWHTQLADLPLVTLQSSGALIVIVGGTIFNAGAIAGDPNAGQVQYPWRGVGRCGVCEQVCVVLTRAAGVTRVCHRTTVTSATASR